MIKRKFLITVSTLLVLLMALSIMACSPSEDPPDNGEEPPDEEIVINVPLSREIESMDFVYATSWEANWVFQHFYDTLFWTDADYEYVGRLVESWEVEEDVWTLKIREDAAFHNGDPITAHDIKASLTRQIEAPETRQGHRIARIVDMQVEGDYTLILVTDDPFPGLRNILTICQIQPVHVAEEMGADDFATHPVGSGPYKLVTWDRDVKIELEANDDYWGGRPDIDRITFHPIVDMEARMSALLTGEIDLMYAVPPDRVAELEANPDIYVDQRVGSWLYMGLNTFVEPYNDPRVRQALNYAIDVDTIIEAVLHGTADPMVGPFFKSTIGYDDSMSPYPYDPEKAKELLADAGYPDGFTLTIHTRAVGVEGTSNPLEVAQVIAEQLPLVGIDVVIEIEDQALFFDRYRAKEFETYLMTWPDQPEPSRYLMPLFHSQTRGYYYANDKTDELLEAGERTHDAAERERIYRELKHHLYEDAPFVFMYDQKTVWAFRNEWKDWGMKAPYDGYIYFFDLNKPY